MKRTQVHSARHGVVEEAKQGDFFACVKLTDEDGDPENYCGENLPDCDGDCIVARGEAVFRLARRVQPEFRFQQGSDRAYLCRLLHKFIEILEGSHGEDLVGLSTDWLEFDRACRKPDGDIRFFNRNDREQALNEMYAETKKAAQKAPDSSGRRRHR